MIRFNTQQKIDPPPSADHDVYFMNQALTQAGIALADHEFPVGCVLVYDEKVIADGSRKGTTTGFTNEIDHAEIIALKRLAHLKMSVDHSKITLYSTMEPCLMCFAAAIISGIGRIVYAYEDVMGGGTGCDRSILPPIYKDHHIRIVSGVLREESLRLFKDFFGNPGNGYLRDTLLAEYTLKL